MVRKVEKQRKEKLGGEGKGFAYTYQILQPEELLGHGRMYSKIELQPESTISWHQHVGETEPYFILEGEGIFIDNDKSRTPVSAGDVCIIEPGQWHAMENNSKDKPLVFMALIYND